MPVPALALNALLAAAPFAGPLTPPAGPVVQTNPSLADVADLVANSTPLVNNNLTLTVIDDPLFYGPGEPGPVVLDARTGGPGSTPILGTSQIGGYTNQIEVLAVEQGGSSVPQGTTGIFTLAPVRIRMRALDRAMPVFFAELAQGRSLSRADMTFFEPQQDGSLTVRRELRMRNAFVSKVTQVTSVQPATYIVELLPAIIGWRFILPDGTRVEFAWDVARGTTIPFPN